MRAEPSENEVFSDGYAEPPHILCKDREVHQITTFALQYCSRKMQYVIVLNMMIFRNIENREVVQGLETRFGADLIRITLCSLGR